MPHHPAIPSAERTRTAGVAGVAILAALVLLTTAGGAGAVTRATSNATVLVSIGPAGGNGAFEAVTRYVANGPPTNDAYPDPYVGFVTRERLVAADTDGRLDVYRRRGGALTLVSAGSAGGNGPYDAAFAGAGSGTVYFSTNEKLVAADTDARVDVYAPYYNDGSIALLSGGSGGAGNGDLDVRFEAVGSGRALISTREALVPQDTDTARDVYELLGPGERRLLTRGSTSSGRGSAASANIDATFAGLAGQGAGTVLYFETTERLVPADTDRRKDVYRSRDGAIALVSTGPKGGNGDFDAAFAGTNRGAPVYFTTRERLVKEDADGSADVYARSDEGVTKLVSAGPAGGNGSFDATFVAVSRGGQSNPANAFFTTKEKLVSADTDASFDVYDREGDVLGLASTGPNDAAGGHDAFFAALDETPATTTFGRIVYFTTRARLVASDTDGALDVYRRQEGATRLISTGPAGGNGELDVRFEGVCLQANRSHVYLTTQERLVGGDTDAWRDIYDVEVASDGRPFSVAHVSTGAAGGNGAFDASFGAVGEDAPCPVAFTTRERLTAEDTDSTFDVYARPGS
jgi:hypothetical protein